MKRIQILEKNMFEEDGWETTLMIQADYLSLASK